MFEIGASLREARIKRGLSPQDVHKAIRIRDRYLQALEDERWELLPGDAYAKGFLRTYADYLGLDGNLYIDEYNSRFASAEEQPLAPQPMPRTKSGGGRSVGLLRPLLAIGAIVAVVAAVAAWQLDSGSKNAGSSSPPPTTTTTAGTTTTTTTGKKNRKPPVALPKQAVLVASRGTCWLEIRSGGATGTIVYENTLQQGQSHTVSLSSGSLWIWIGHPTSLDIHLGGKILQGIPTQPVKILLTPRGWTQA